MITQAALTVSWKLQSTFKQVENLLGEALGINLIKSEYLDAFKRKLATVDEQDYFERAMELLIEEKGSVFRPLNVGSQTCVEVDFQEDLEQSRTMVSGQKCRQFSTQRTTLKVTFMIHLIW